MKLSNQICSIEQAKELRELGVKQDSLFYHFPNPNTPSIKKKYKLPDYDVRYGKELIGKETHSIRTLVLRGDFQSTFSAFTVGELSLMLGDYYPSWSFKFKGKQKWIATTITKDMHKDGKTITTEPSFDRYDKTQAQALATLLIATIKVGHIKVKDVNKRLINE
jgi:hypothetical protein